MTPSILLVVLTFALFLTIPGSVTAVAFIASMAFNLIMTLWHAMRRA